MALTRRLVTLMATSNVTNEVCIEAKSINNLTAVK